MASRLHNYQWWEKTWFNKCLKQTAKILRDYRYLNFFLEISKKIPDTLYTLWVYILHIDVVHFYWQYKGFNEQNYLPVTVETEKILSTLNVTRRSTVCTKTSACVKSQQLPPCNTEYILPSTFLICTVTAQHLQPLPDSSHLCCLQYSSLFSAFSVCTCQKVKKHITHKKNTMTCALSHRQTQTETH